MALARMIAVVVRSPVCLLCCVPGCQHTYSECDVTYAVLGNSNLSSNEMGFVTDDHVHVEQEMCDVAGGSIVKRGWQH